MSPPPKYKEETTISPPPMRKDQTGEFVVVAHLHVLPYGGLARVYVVYANSFPYEISRAPKEPWHAEIAPANHPDEGGNVSRTNHLLLRGFIGGEYFLAQSNVQGSGCFICGEKIGANFKIAFNQKVTLGGPTGPGTVEIWLTKPA